MANGAAVRSGLSTMMQDHLSQKVVSLVSNIMPLVYFILGKDGNKQGFYELGRFASGALFSGIPTTSVRKETILNSDKYMPMINISTPLASDGKALGQRDSMPERQNATTKTTASHFQRPYFKWFERVDPLQVWKKDIRRTRNAAGNEQKANVAVGDLFKAETELVLTTHLTTLNKLLMGTTGTGAPSDVDAEVWDAPYSIPAALMDDNVYGGLDRSLSANSWWRGNYITDHKAGVLTTILDEALYTTPIANKGLDRGLLIVGRDLFPVFREEIRAKGGVQLNDGLPDMGEIGFKRQILRYNNIYVIMDPEMPCFQNGGSKNAAMLLNLDTWTVGISPDANFKVDEPFDQSKIKGGVDAITSVIRTEMIGPVCEAPSLNVYWEDVGDELA